MHGPHVVPFTAHIPRTSSVFQDALGDVSGQGWRATVRGSSRTAANSSHLLERIGEAVKTDFVLYYPVLSISHLRWCEILAPCDIFLSQRRL